jgi:hypothetical protein
MRRSERCIGSSEGFWDGRNPSANNMFRSPCCSEIQVCVMAGLCPGHPGLSASALEDVDARHTAGHDEPNGEAEFDVLVLPAARSRHAP